MANEPEGQEPQKTPDGTPEPENGGQPEPQSGETLTPEEIAELKRKASESSQNFARLKKAEAELEKLKEKGQIEPSKDLSGEDVYALIEAKVPREDFDKVKDFAGYKKVSLSEALKDKTLQTILADSAEERRTAMATQTKSPRGTTKVTGEVLLEQARSGKLPDKDEDIAALAKARVAAK